MEIRFKRGNSRHINEEWVVRNDLMTFLGYLNNINNKRQQQQESERKIFLPSLLVELSYVITVLHKNVERYSIFFCVSFSRMKGMENMKKNKKLSRLKSFSHRMFFFAIKYLIFCAENL